MRAFFLFMIQAKAEKYRQNMEHWVKQKPVVQLMKSIGGWLPEKVLADGGYVLLTKKLVQQFITHHVFLKDKWREWLTSKGMDTVTIMHKDATLDLLCEFVGDAEKDIGGESERPTWSGPPQGLQVGGAYWHRLEPLDALMEARAPPANEESDNSEDGEEDESDRED